VLLFWKYRLPVEFMNSNGIGAGDIEASGHARLGSYSGEPRLAVAINEEYGWYGQR